MLQQNLRQLVRAITPYSRRPARRSRHCWRPWLETLEDRLAPATYAWDQAAGTLVINLEQNESLDVTEGNGALVFTLDPDTAEFTAIGSDEASQPNDHIIIIDKADLATSVEINNSESDAGSTNDVTFDGFIAADFTTGSLAVSITEEDTIGMITVTGGFELQVSASLNFTTNEKIVINDGSSLANIDDGEADIVLQANTGGETSGHFIGIEIDDAAITTIGSGNISLTGRGGDTGSENIGVSLANGAAMQSTASGVDAGTITISGTGGDDNRFNSGVLIKLGAAVTAVDGSITINGTGGDGSNSNHGVFFFGAGTTVSSAGGNVEITGTGGDHDSAHSNLGVNIFEDVEVSTTTGSITIHGTGGNGTHLNHGVLIEEATVSSDDGSIQITGEGGLGTGNNNKGVFILATVVSTGGSGNITITGTGGDGTNDNSGVQISGIDAQIETVDGNIEITATAGDENSFAFELLDEASIKVTGSADVALIADSMTFDTDTAIDATDNTVTLIPETANISILIGGPNVPDVPVLTNAELNVITAGTINIGNEETASIGVSDDIEHDGDAHFNVVAGRNIIFGLHSSWTTEDGNLFFSANQQEDATEGNFAGILIDNSTITTTGSGNISLFGRGGDTADDNHGIYLRNEAEIASLAEDADAGTITIVGTGGDGVSRNAGVVIEDPSTEVVSVNGDIQIIGQGGNGLEDINVGVAVVTGALIASVEANITVDGSGGAGTSLNAGFVMEFDAVIFSLNGNVHITGTGGNGTEEMNHGVILQESSQITALGGNIGITGGGGGTGDSSDNNSGVRLEHEDTRIHSVSGDIEITASAGIGDSTALELLNEARIQATDDGDVTVIADSVTIDTDTALFIILAPGNTITLRPETAGTQIDLGGPNATGVLGLTADELDRISADTLIIGSSAAGTLSITDDITRDDQTDMELHSGGAILFDPGTVDTGSGDLLLAPGVGPGLGVQPVTAGTDIIADTVSFASQLSITIDGTIVDDEFTQLNVDGTVELDGVDLVLGGNFFPVVGDEFVIVSAANVTGRFNGLNDGDVITFNSQLLSIHYSATDVTLVANPHVILDNSHGFYVDAERGFWNDVFGGNEKWLLGEVNQFGNFWYFILPDGRFFEWDGIPGSLTGEMLAILTDDFHKNAELVYEASNLQIKDAIKADRAEELDSERGLHVDARGFFQDALGGNEKWLRGEAHQFDNIWYFILPNGEFYEWNGVAGVLDGHLLEDFDTDAVHLKPELIFQASQAILEEEAADDAQNLDRTFGLYVDARGFFQDAFGGNEKWLRGINNQFDNPWYFILPDGEFFEWDGTPGSLTGFSPGSLTGFSHGVLGAAAHLNPKLIYEAANWGELLDPAHVATAFTLDRQHGFHVDHIGLWEDSFGGGERWLRGELNNFNNPWYFILPDGRFFEWDGNVGSLTGEELFDFDEAFHLSPELIHRAFHLEGLS